MWYKHTMEYYSALKKKKIPSYVITWMNLEDTMLNEIASQEKKILYDSTYIRSLKLSKS